MADERSTRTRPAVLSTLQGLAGMVLALSLVVVGPMGPRPAPGRDRPRQGISPGAARPLFAPEAKAFLAQHPEALLLDVREHAEKVDPPTSSVPRVAAGAPGAAGN